MTTHKAFSIHPDSTRAGWVLIADVDGCHFGSAPSVGDARAFIDLWWIEKDARYGRFPGEKSLAHLKLRPAAVQAVVEALSA